MLDRWKCRDIDQVWKLYTLFQNGRHFSIFCFHANWPLRSLSRLNILLNFTFESEAIRVNLHGNKRILNRRPFWDKVYRSLVMDLSHSMIYTEKRKVVFSHFLKSFCLSREHHSTYDLQLLQYVIDKLSRKVFFAAFKPSQKSVALKTSLFTALRAFTN